MLKLFILLQLFSTNVFAFSLPGNLNSADRTNILKIIGLPSSTKLLSNPYPIGGSSGVEIGVSQTIIGTEELEGIGDSSGDQKDFSLTQVNLSKGLFRDFDIGVELTPMTTFQVQSFSFQARTVLTKSADTSPVISLFLFTTNTNFKNLVQVETYGADLIGAVHTEKISLYTGFGNIRTFGKFAGGSSTLNSSNKTETSAINSLHLLLGTSVQFKPYFLSVQMDRYDQITYSAKIGTRF